MWKRLLVVIIALVGTFSVVFATNNDLFAETNYNAGSINGTISGRVNKAPSNLTLAGGSTNIGMQKGDKVLIGVKNPKDGTDLGWQLIHFDSNYNITSVSCTNSSGATVACDLMSNELTYNYATGATQSAWYTMSTNSIGTVTPVSKVPDWNNQADVLASGWNFYGIWGINYHLAITDLKNTNYKAPFDALNNNISGSKAISVVADRDLGVASQVKNSGCMENNDAACDFGKASVNTGALYNGKKAYLENFSNLYGSWLTAALTTPPKNAFMISSADLSFPTDYAADFVHTSLGSEGGNKTFARKVVSNGGSDTYDISSLTATVNIRPSLMINTNDVVFATSNGTSNSLATITEPKLNAGYASIYDATSAYGQMKMRVLEPTMWAGFTELKSEDGVKLTSNNGKIEVDTDQTILIRADANDYYSSTLSVILFDKNGAFKYYKPLERSKGLGDYTFDTTGIPKGEYQLAVVNEVYNDLTNEPAYSSLISDVQAIIIDDPDLHTITYKDVPGEGASTGTYEFGKNVNKGQQVGTITRADGAVPIHYEIISDGDNTYQNFEIEGLDTSGNSSAKSLALKIKSTGAPDIVQGSNSLKAKTYKFCIFSKDANGNPVTDEVGKNKICASFKVEKTNATITFSSTTQIDKKIGDSVSNGAITYSNTDALQSSNITYSLDGDIDNVLSVKANSSDPKKFEVSVVDTYSGAGVPTTFQVSATIADTENYNSATTTTTLPIYVYKGLGPLTWTANKQSYEYFEVVADSVIGNLQAIDGIGPYTYTLTNSSDDGYVARDATDNDSFAIVNGENVAEGTKVNLKTISSLSAGSYKIQFKVTDTKNDTVYTSAVIKVEPKGQSGFIFTDKQDGTEELTELPIAYSKDGKQQLFTKGGNSGGAVTYKVKDGQPNDILSVTPAGELTWNKIGGPVIVQATKEGDSEYTAISTELKVTINVGNQSVEFPEPPTYKVVGNTSFAFAAQLNREDASTSTITYTSTYPDVCSIDTVGEVTIKSVGTCELKAENTDSNYEIANDTVSFAVYDKITGLFEQNTGMNPLTVENPAGSLVGVVKDATGGDQEYSYSFKNTTDLFTISSDGSITLLRSLTKEDLVGKWSNDDASYVINETIVITDGSGNKSEDIIAKILCEGETANVTIEGAADNKLHKSYAIGSFVLNAQNLPTGNTIKYTKIEDSAGLLSTLTEQGRVGIQKAGTSTQFAKVRATMPANGGYKEQNIELEIYIDKATQTVAFDAGTQSEEAFKKDKSFSVLATSTPGGADITYEASPDTTCTISGNTITMEEQGICTIKAIAKKANYSDAEVSKDILFYPELGGEFVLTHNSLEAKGNNDDSIGINSILVGYMEASGGTSDTSKFTLSTNSGDKNVAQSLFTVTESDGNVFLKHELKAEDLAQYAIYDAINHVYLLKIQVDVTNGSDNKTVDCEIKIKGAPLKNLNFMNSTNNIITKVYTKNDADKIFDLGVNGNEGNGIITYSLKTGSDVADGAITLSGTGNKKATIVHADDKYAIVIADITQSKGYAKTQSEVKIKVDKANQDNFKLGSDKQNVSIDLDGDFNLCLPANDSGKTVEFESNPSDVVEVLADGQTLHALKVGSSIVTIKSPGNQNYNEKILTVNVQVYGALKGEIKQSDDQILQADNTAIKNKVVGTFTIKDGQSALDDMTVKFPEGNSYLTLSDISTTSNPGTYELRLSNPVTASDIANCAYDAENDVYLIPVKISVTDPALPEGEKTIEVSSNIEIKGADMESDIDFADAQDGKISKVYSPGGEITLSLVEKAYIDPTTVTYRRMSDLARGVVTIGKVGSDYIAYIEGASQEGDPKVYIEATIPSQKGYKGRNIETEVSITKAEQNFDFDKIPTKIKVGTSAQLTFTSIPKGNNGIVILESDGDKVTITNGRIPEITAVTKGENIKISATAKGNENYNDKVVERYIEVYDGASLLFDPTSPYPQANSVSSEANDPAGTFSCENGAGNVQVALEDVANFAGNTHFQITNSGTLSFRTNITADILKNYPWNETEKAYEMQVKFKLTDNGEITYVTESVFVKGASLNNISFKDTEGNATDTIIRNYADKQFMLELTGKVENTWPYGEVSYSLEVENSSESDGSSSIIESIDAVTGITKIRNANLAGSSEVANAKASIKAAHGYDEQEVKAKIIINKADQPDFKFGSSNYSMELNDGELNVILLNKLSGGSVTYDIVDESKVSYDAETDKFKPLALGSTIVTATTDTNDRNYNVAQAQTTIQVIQGAADVLMIQIDQGSTVTYGDTGITASIKNSTVTGNVTGQTWSSSNAEVATIDETTGAITIHGRGQTDITLTQEIEGRTEKVTSVPVMLNVKRKVLYVKISDAQKLVGEDMPIFEIEQVTGLVGADTFISPSSFICLDGSDNHVNSYTGVGEYEIKGNFNESDNPNYILKVDNGATSTVTNGILSVKQDGSDPSWYTVRSNANPTDDGWYNKDVFLDLNLMSGQEYDEISDKIDGEYDLSIPVQEDGIHDKDIYFKASRNNAIATPQEATLKVDQTNPSISSITGKTINDSTFAKVLNTLTLNVFFKPGSEITIHAVDIAPQADIESSAIAKITYEVYSEIPDEEGNTLLKEGTVTSNQATFTMDDLGEYNICAVATDNAGNESPQTCQKATISKIDVDVDGDKKPDFNDPNEDGCPDLNIKWKDPNDPAKWIVINGDRNYDGIPDLNVDSDGDGKPNLNIDTDGDNKPDINLVILKQGDWTAGSCLVDKVEEYSGGTTAVEPQINIDTGDDQIPDIDMDLNGDMKPDYNITKPNEIKPYMNVGPIHAQWIPKKDFIITNFAYDTDDSFKALLNIDSDRDGKPDINVDLDDDGKPDINIDLDFDNTPDVDIDGDGDGKPDINLDPDKTGSPTSNIVAIKEWKPNHNVNNNFPYDTMLIGLKDSLEDNEIVIEKPDGSKFPLYYSLKVRNITEQIDDSERLIMQAFISSDTEVKEIFDVKLYADGIQIDPDETIRVKLPLNEDYRASETLKLIVEQKDSTFVDTPYERAEEYISYETNFLGKVGVIADMDKSLPKPIQPEQEPANEEIGGAYGGSFTGDTTNAFNSFLIAIGALGVLCYQLHHKKNME